MRIFFREKVSDNHKSLPEKFESSIRQPNDTEQFSLVNYCPLLINNEAEKFAMAPQLGSGL